MDNSKKELRKQQRHQDDFVIIKNIIDDIFNTRYRIDDIYKKNFSARESIEKIIYNTSFLDDNFGIGTKEKVKNKIAENALIREKKPRNSILIEDRWDIFVAAKDLYYLNEIDFKKLKFASSYLCSGADMEYVIKKHETSIPSVIAMLADLKLQTILKPIYYENLKRYISIEKILISNELSAKKTLLYNIVHVLNESNYNLDYALNYFNLPLNLFKKLLHEISIYPFFEEEIRNRVKLLLNDETDKKVK